MTNPEAKPKVTLITDGACSGNPGPGGWAVIFRAASGTERTKVGGEPETTNNRMELTALLEGLRGLNRPCEVTVITDSKADERSWLGAEATALPQDQWAWMLIPAPPSRR